MASLARLLYRRVGLGSSYLGESDARTASWRSLGCWGARFLLDQGVVTTRLACSGRAMQRAAASFSWHEMVPGFEGDMLDMARVQECRSSVFGSKPMPSMALGRKRGRRKEKVVE